jgi:hypothetical protein
MPAPLKYQAKPMVTEDEYGIAYGVSGGRPGAW